MKEVVKGSAYVMQCFKEASGFEKWNEKEL